MPRPTVALTLCLLAVTAGAAAGTASAPVGAVTAFELAQEFDRAQFRLAVQADGSARWTFRYERTLANESEREQFEAFAATFTANETRLYTDFRNQSRTLVERGQAATGRAMAARSFAREAFVSTQLNDVGVVEMTFTWTGFARPDGDRIVVGDVFEGGLYVGPDQSLVVQAGEGLAFRSVEPTGTVSGGTLATSDTVTWQGERTFADNHPRVVLGPVGDGPATTVNGGPATDGGTDTVAADPGSPLWPVGLVLAVIAVALVAFVYRRRSRTPVGGGPAGRDGDPRAETPAVDEAALLNDEERIAGLLREHGGRMRQSAIVEATGWSKSKVSMVLSEMADEGQVRKLRVGRENIVSLPGHEPDAARSPHDDEG